MSDYQTPSPLQQEMLNKIAEYLAIRDHSPWELQQKLYKKFPDEELITWGLEYAREAGWLLEEQALVEKIQDEFNRKNKSISYINAQLRKRGLPSTQSSEEIEAKKAFAVLKKKFKDFPSLSKEDKRKAFQHLAYRGFNSGLLDRAMKLDDE